MKISSGRAPKLAPKEKKLQTNEPKHRICAADTVALICALMCAVCLISWSNTGSSEKRVAAVFAESAGTSAKAEEEKGFWDHFSEAVANAFGYSG